MVTLAPAVHREDYGDKLIQDYMEIFNTYSIANEAYGKISFHVILGQALRQIHFAVGSRKIDIRVHLLLIKPQGTGKGAGYTFVERISKDLDLRFQSLTESTDAGLVGTVVYDPATKQNVVVPGLLHSADIVGMEEASVLFDYANEFSKKNMTYMQQAMNPLWDASNTITKKLGTETIEIHPHASFVLTTYPPDRLVDKLLKTGFVDRVIPIFEDVTLADRLAVIRKLSEIFNYDKALYEAKYLSVVKRFQKVIEFGTKTGQQYITVTDDIHKLMLQIIEEFAMKILDASPKAREKLEHFITRLYEVLFRLAAHHALISLRKHLDVSDILYARLTYMPIWKNLIISIESLLIISPIETHRRHRIIREAIYEYDRQIKRKEFVKEGVWVRRLSMIENLQQKWDSCSKETADNNMRKIEKLPATSYDKFSKVAQYEKDRFFEAKDIGGVIYVKKIKDIKE